MERRAFLALLASAPIAALAPWPQFLPKKKYLPIGHPSCGCKMCVLLRQFREGKMSEIGGLDWFADQDVASGSGYIRTGLDANGDFLIERIYPSSDVAVDMPAEQARLAQAIAQAIDPS